MNMEIYLIAFPFNSIKFRGLCYSCLSNTLWKLFCCYVFVYLRLGSKKRVMQGLAVKSFKEMYIINDDIVFFIVIF